MVNVSIPFIKRAGYCQSLKGSHSAISDLTKSFPECSDSVFLLFFTDSQKNGQGIFPLTPALWNLGTQEFRGFLFDIDFL